MCCLGGVGRDGDLEMPEQGLKEERHLEAIWRPSSVEEEGVAPARGLRAWNRLDRWRAGGQLAFLFMRAE